MIMGRVHRTMSESGKWWVLRSYSVQICLNMCFKSSYLTPKLVATWSMVPIHDIYQCDIIHCCTTVWFMCGRKFRHTLESTSRLQSRQFALLPTIMFLTLFSSSPKVNAQSAGVLELTLISSKLMTTVLPNSWMLWYCWESGVKGMGSTSTSRWGTGR